MFQQALARCEAGETGGIVVALLDRFARLAVDALESIKRLNEADARLVSVEDNFDGSAPMGRFAIGILTLIAELELDRITEGWSTAVQAAVARGVHISATPPAGYRQDEESGRLVVGEKGGGDPGAVPAARQRSVVDVACRFLDQERRQVREGRRGLVGDGGQPSGREPRLSRGGPFRGVRESGGARADRDPGRV
jgi:hypothetical protein